MKSPRGKTGSGSTEAASPRRAAGVGADEFARRRRALMRRIGSDALAVIPAAPMAERTRGIHHPYRQSSDFAYLTGFGESSAVAVLAPGRTGRRGVGEYILFCAPHDEKRAIWDGPRAGLRGAVRDFGADRAFSIEEFDEVFPRLAADYRRVYLPRNRDEMTCQLLRVLHTPAGGSVATGAPWALFALEEPLHEMRLRKSRAEISLMRTAAEISAAGHRRAMRTCRPGLFEYQLAAEVHHEFESAGAVPAYPSIVGGGANGCILHYVRNGDALKDGDLVLMDAGAEYRLYASDVTRTFPVGGRFRSAQRELYELVLEAQLEAIQKVRPGNNWNDVHGAATRVLTRGLVALGLLKGRVTRLVQDGEYRRFYMHRTGHWLGMDVHDVGNYEDNARPGHPPRQPGRPRRFEAGMTLTIEPGLYLRGADVPRRWRNVGIRIEDSVTVTANGARVLSTGVPKETEAIEALVGAG